MNTLLTALLAYAVAFLTGIAMATVTAPELCPTWKDKLVVGIVVSIISGTVLFVAMLVTSYLVPDT